MLDGFPVEVGDTLYDLLLNQQGLVIMSSNSQYTLDFGMGRTMTYVGNGEFAGRRRLYWRTPILTLPQKNDPQWQLLQAVVNAIRANP